MTQCACSQIPKYERIGNRGSLNYYLDLVYGMAEAGILEITCDMGDNVDYAHIEMFCKQCGKKFILVCEAYHGSGGHIGHIKSKPIRHKNTKNKQIRRKKV